MTTFVIMQNRIANEVRDVSTAAASDIESEIQAAIVSAVACYARERFYFNEATGTFSTVSGQEYYSSSDLADIPNMVEIDSMKINTGSRTYTLIPRDFSYIDQISSSTSAEGDPTDFVYYKQQIRVWPIPNAVRTVTVAYVKKLTALSASSDSNAWTTDAEELIRLKAKHDLYLNLLKNAQKAAELETPIMFTHASLKRETTMKASSGRLRPTSF